jgi:protein O-GlcNAc transferase
MELIEKSLNSLRHASSSISPDQRLHIAIGDAYQALDCLPQAEAAFRQALSATPNSLDRQLLATLAVLLSRLQSRGKFVAFEAVARALVAAQPSLALGWRMLGMALQATGHSTEAEDSYRRSLALEPTAGNHSDLLLAQQYVDGVTPEKLLATHREWDAAHAKDLLPASTIAANRIKLRRPLRIGFVSMNFSRHPLGFLALPAIEAFDREQCTVFCYSDRVAFDEFTERFRASAAVWRSGVGTSHERLAEIIRQDEIDVLVDLEGHTTERLMTFARRPAPLQVTWLGYVGTTGMSAMDGLVADRFHVMPGEESNYVETILRLPNGYACYQAPGYAPDGAPLPALRTDYVTFGCFNNPAKFSPQILRAWNQVLRLVPHSRLFLKYSGLDEPQTQDYLRTQLCCGGIETERICFEGWSSHRELLEAYSHVDIALDTQPYSGGLTTCEALWMGVPVVTYPGRTFAGRHSTSHLTNAGYGQFVANNVDEYIQLAIDWASRLNELATLRLAMRSNVDRSLLCNAPLFAHYFLEALWKAWSQRPLP